MSEARRRRGGQSGIVRLDTVGAAPIFTPMSVMRDPRRLSRADLSFRPFEPCLPRPAKEPPAGAGWIHEIKHDGFRIIARRDAKARAAVHSQWLRFHGALPEDRRCGREPAGAIMRHRR